MTLAEIVRQAILDALQRNDWIQSKAAEELGISRRSMCYRVKRMGIAHPSGKHWRSVNGGPGGHRLPKKRDI